MALLIQQLWADYNVALEMHPLLIKSITAGIVMGAADATGQCVERIKKEGFQSRIRLDWLRCARFTIFGTFILAPWTHYYFRWLDRKLPPTETAFSLNNCLKVIFDQFIQSPIFTAVIIGSLSAMEGNKWDKIRQTLQEDLKPTFFASCKSLYQHLVP
jgi:peroxisomal membrane protein 2